MCHSSTAQDFISKNWNIMQCSITDKQSKQDQMAPPCQGQQTEILSCQQYEPKSARAAEFLPLLCTIPSMRNKLSQKTLQKCSWRGHLDNALGATGCPPRTPSATQDRAWAEQRTCVCKTSEQVHLHTHYCGAASPLHPSGWVDSVPDSVLERRSSGTIPQPTFWFRLRQQT